MGGTGVGADEVAQFVVGGEKFEKGAAAVESGAETLGATDGSIDAVHRGAGGFKTLAIIGGGADGAFAGGAEGADETLGEDEVEALGDHVGFDAEIEHAEDGADGVAGVDGGENEVAGHGGLECDACGFGVADFADHDDIGVLAEHGAEEGGEAFAIGVIDRELGGGFDLDFDGVFDGDDVAEGGAAGAEERVEGGRFTGACGSADEEEASVEGEFAGDLFGDEFGEAELFEKDGGVGGIEDANNELLAMERGDKADAVIDTPEFEGCGRGGGGWFSVFGGRGFGRDGGGAGGEVAFLDGAALGGVEFAEDFDHGGELDAVFTVEGDDIDEVAIDADAEKKIFRAGFEVDVAGMAAEADKEGEAEEEDGFAGAGGIVLGIVGEFSASVDEGDGIHVEGFVEERVGGAAKRDQRRLAFLRGPRRAFESVLLHDFEFVDDFEFILIFLHPLRFRQFRPARN